MQCNIIIEYTRIFLNVLEIKLICELKTFILELILSFKVLEVSISFQLLWYHLDSTSLRCKVMLLNNQ